MSALLDEIAALEAEAAEASGLRIEIAVLIARDDEKLQYIVELEGRVATLERRVADLERVIAAAGSS